MRWAEAEGLTSTFLWEELPSPLPVNLSRVVKFGEEGASGEKPVTTARGGGSPEEQQREAREKFFSPSPFLRYRFERE